MLRGETEAEVVALALRRPASAPPGRSQRGCRGGREGDSAGGQRPGGWLPSSLRQASGGSEKLQSQREADVWEPALL